MNAVNSSCLYNNQQKWGCLPGIEREAVWFSIFHGSGQTGNKLLLDRQRYIMRGCK